MKLRFFVFIAYTGLLACTEICFKEPQPKGIKSLNIIPAKLHGYYLIQENGIATDTLIVMNTGYIMNNDEVSYLSDSIVLKYYKGYYFLNTREDLTWHLRILKPDKKGNLIYSAMEQLSDNEEERSAFLKRLSSDIAVVETDVDGKRFYVIDPTPKELMMLIKKEYFKDQTFTRANR